MVGEWVHDVGDGVEVWARQLIELMGEGGWGVRTVVCVMPCVQGREVCDGERGCVEEVAVEGGGIVWDGGFGFFF